MNRFYLPGAVLVGAAFGLLVYFVNFSLIAPMVFPWFEMGRNWIDAFSHIIFGVSLGVAYIWLRKPKTSSGQASGRLPYIIY
jgi:hypothetical protein